MSEHNVIRVTLSRHEEDNGWYSVDSDGRVYRPQHGGLYADQIERFIDGLTNRSGAKGRLTVNGYSYILAPEIKPFILGEFGIGPYVGWSNK